ncbi:TniQ family protein [Nostoc sp.]|uniref:TniQ family protein n=1 Tax=Nostoc sp. TaxID=1180 RepID=UPI002FFC8548
MLTKYELWNFKLPLIPPRSHLYHIEPIGIGTPLLESLTGYVARLAEAHCLPPGVLMERELTSVFNKTYGSNNLHKIYPFTGALNGTGVMAADLRQALQILTLRNDLQFLTLLTWSELLPSRNLLRSIRAWCPTCYEERRTTSQLVFEHLLWSLDVVKVCPHHQQKLSQKCPHCCQTNYVLAWRSRPGYCSKCLKWLGMPLDTQISAHQNLEEHDLQFEIWIAQSVGELLAKAPYLTPLPLKDSIAKALCSYVSQVAEGNVAAFARQLQIPRNTVWVWCKGENQPSIKALLQICYCLKISLLDFLIQGVKSANSFQAVRLLPLQSKPQTRASAKSFDANKVQQNLEAVLESNDSPSPSMEEVARRLECDRRTIFRHFPSLCRAISAKYLNDRKAIFLRNVQQSCDEVRRIALSLHNQGVYPSEARVSEQMSMPGYLRYKEVRTALQDIQCQLGKC